MHLTLGTVQFGLDYGVSNTSGQLTEKEIKAILNHANDYQIDTLDTATAYGNSEHLLGKLAKQHAFKIITKIPALTKEVGSILPFVERSLTHLKTDKLHGLLFHDTDSLLKHPNKTVFLQEIQQLKQEHVIGNCGASLYHPAQWHALKKLSPFDILQVPVNVFDQRFIDDTLLTDFKNQGVKLHCRSIFLQGLLLMPRQQWPSYFTPFHTELNRFHHLVQTYGCSPLTLAFSVLVHKVLNNIDAHEVIDQLVVGCCSKQQLAEIIAAFSQAKASPLLATEVEAMSSTDELLINPSNWSI